MRWLFVLALLLAGCTQAPAPASLPATEEVVLAGDVCSLIVGFQPMDADMASQWSRESVALMGEIAPSTAPGWLDDAAGVLLNLACPSGYEEGRPVGLSFFGVALQNGTDATTGALRVAWLGGAATERPALEAMQRAVEPVTQMDVTWTRSSAAATGNEIGIMLEDSRGDGYNAYVHYGLRGQPADYGGFLVTLVGASETWHLQAPGTAVTLDTALASWSEDTEAAAFWDAASTCDEPLGPPRLNGGGRSCATIPTHAWSIAQSGPLEVTI